MRTLKHIIILLVCQLAVIAAMFRVIGALLTGNEHRIKEIEKGYDLLGNTAFNGVAGEYISTRANRGQKEGAKWACVLCKFLDMLDKGHCERYPSPVSEEFRDKKETCL